MLDATAISGTITLQSPLPILTNSMVLNGPGATSLTIDGGNSFRLFFIDAPGQSVSFNGVTLAKGMARGGNGAAGTPGVATAGAPAPVGAEGLERRLARAGTR